MIVVTQNAEAKLLDVVRDLKGDVGDNYALYFHLTALQEQHRSDFQIKIAVNILNDVFRDSEGIVVLSRAGDVFVVYHGSDKALLEKAIFQLRYLFVDDPLANHPDGSENEDFCTMYDLSFQWRAFFSLCNDLLGESTKQEKEEEVNKQQIEERKTARNLNPKRLIQVMDALDTIDLGLALRRQPICAKPNQQEFRVVFEEMYINIGHLSTLLGGQYNLVSNRPLFKYLTLELDAYILQLLKTRPEVYLQRPVSLNLNLETVLSDMFVEFSEQVEAKKRSTIVLEIHVGDVFGNMPLFMKAQELAHRYGYRICIDGLTDVSFVQVDREKLGFDLAKLQWNADMVADLETEENKRLAEAIRVCGSNRMILCWCDSVHAIDYGHALGISLFQGRYPDRLLDPEATVIN